MKKVKKAGVALTSLALCAALALTPGTMAFADIGGEAANSNDVAGKCTFLTTIRNPASCPSSVANAQMCTLALGVTPMVTGTIAR